MNCVGVCGWGRLCNRCCLVCCSTSYVLVDAHLLSAPVIVDINGDGGMEMLVAVSFMFDDEQVDFDNAYAPGLNNTHIDPSK